jgi:hypothetical protein
MSQSSTGNAFDGVVTPSAINAVNYKAVIVVNFSEVEVRRKTCGVAINNVAFTGCATEGTGCADEYVVNAIAINIANASDEEAGVVKSVGSCNGKTIISVLIS